MAKTEHFFNVRTTTRAQTVLLHCNNFCFAMQNGWFILTYQKVDSDSVPRKFPQGQFPAYADFNPTDQGVAH
jgi:hypothetical protein